MTIEERRGIYEPRNCDVRIWKEKEGTRLGYDNIQCSSKKTDGACFCKRHKNLIDKHGPWWLGLITEPRPEKPIHHLDPEEKKRKHNWLNDEVEEDRSDEYSLVELKLLLQMKEKEDEEIVYDTEMDGWAGF